MKNLMWCFMMIAFTALLVQCKADDQNDEIENLVDTPRGNNGGDNDGGINNNDGGGNNNNGNNGGGNNGNNGNGGVIDNNILDDRGLPQNIVSPANNPLTTAKVELGRLLFWDPILSGAEDISCATCHHPQFGYADGRALPIGVGGIGLGPARQDGVDDDIGLVQRNSPTIVNTAFNGINP